MAKKTPEQKLAKQLLKAEKCLTREQAQKIIRKAEEAKRLINEKHNS